MALYDSSKTMAQTLNLNLLKNYSKNKAQENQDTLFDCDN